MSARCFPKLIAMLIVTVLACSTATAGTLNWASATDGDWTDAASWTPSGPPGSNDVALFNQASGGYTVDLSTTTSIDSMTVKTDAVTLNLTGQLDVADTFRVGSIDGEVGNLTITGGGLLNIGGWASVGRQAGATGTLTIQDGTVNATSQFDVGTAGDGTLLIEENGTLQCAKAILGSYSAGTGDATVNGGRWEYKTYMVVGWDGVGNLTVTNGGTVVDTNAANSGETQIGYKAGSRGTVLVEGLGTTWDSGSAVRVGEEGNGELTIRDQAVFNCGDAKVALYSGSTGTVVVDAATWNIANDLFIGGVADAAGGTGMVTIKDGSAVNVTGQTYLWATGLLHLQGGVLTTDSLDGNGGAFAWTGGQLAVTGTDGLTISPSDLLTSVTLTSGKTLTVTDQLVVESGGTLSLAGGSLSCGPLRLQGGTITSTNKVNLDKVEVLRGYGCVYGKVTGGADATVIAGGDLVLGNGDSTDGYDMAGTLNVKEYHVTLLDANRATLGILTTLDDGGVLTAGNGLRLDAGNELIAHGDVLIQGRLLNDGSVVGPTNVNKALVFNDNVTGSGSYSGNIEFRQDFLPGNSPAIISFGGGNASFGVHSTLVTEICGMGQDEFDRLIDINTLNFEGALQLVFDFTPDAGSSFDLFDFSVLTGGFGSIEVLGMNASHLDLSQLSTTGVATVVPEPGSLSLLAMGGLALLRRRRSKQD
ncbi:MAG: PEP-CTERM sorting domain-containing protein [Planctomycetes bacterium]|nr:PEP-CTERM sorting domain-containing protein [Planctomycetota bacterium]